MHVAWDFRKAGREALKGKWLMAATVVIIAILLGGGLTGLINPNVTYHVDDVSVQLYYQTGDITYIVSNSQQLQALGTFLTIYGLIVLFIGSGIALGEANFFIRLQCRMEVSASTVFSRMNIWLKAIGLSIVTGFFVFLWSLLCVIPGIIAAYRYSMAQYLMADNPDMGIMEAIRKSKELMIGNKGRLFCMQFSFIGWQILTIVPLLVLTLIFPYADSAYTVGYVLSLLAAVFVNAYICSSTAAFYQEMIGQWMGGERQAN